MKFDINLFFRILLIILKPNSSINNILFNFIADDMGLATIDFHDEIINMFLTMVVILYMSNVYVVGNYLEKSNSDKEQNIEVEIEL